MMCHPSLFIDKSMPSQLPIIEFETERLICRQWRPSDFPSFARINADPKVMEFFPKLLSTLESNALAESFKDFIELYGFGLWAVELKESNEFIGFVGLSIPTIIFPFSPCVEIAWRIGSHYWGQGYATEAARKALQIGFELLELSEIVSFTAINNLRSRSVMKKLGMQEDRLTFEHLSLPIGHALREHCLYRLQRDQWSWII